MKLISIYGSLVDTEIVRGREPMNFTVRNQGNLRTISRLDILMDNIISAMKMERFISTYVIRKYLTVGTS